VLVLGGGAGSLAAAFELTATPELRERFEVTLLQTGWRLGGKGASGRRASGDQRIEEHGLHVWFGFYREAFGLIRRAYEELGDQAPARPWTSAFSPIERLVLWDRDADDELRSWSVGLPAQPLTQVPQTAPDDPAVGVTQRLLRTWEDFLDDADDGWAAVPAALKLAAAVARASPADDGRALRETARLLRSAVKAQALAERTLPGDPPFELRVLNRLLDLWAALLTGIVEDRVLRPPGDFDPAAIARLDELDFRAWLAPRVHFEDSLQLSFLRVLYDLAFAYEGGDPSRPNVAAGMALENLFRILFGHDGALMLRMEGGMGDVIFAPLYLALAARGVRFRFFHSVTGLRVSEDGRGIAAVDVVEQATMHGGRPYEPLVEVDGQPCWPSEPRWEQLEQGERLRAEGVDLEHVANPLGLGRLSTLSRGTDFDQVVLGISVGALGPLCGELASANGRFATMLSSARTVATQSLQVWLGEQGEPPGVGSKGGIAGGLAKPFDTCCDMTHLVQRESWPAGSDLRRIAYLCGTLPEPADAAAGAAAVRAGAQALVTKSFGEGPGSPLIGPDGRGGGSFDDQYWRANTIGSERYVLTPAGSTKHRLAPGDSGFENLVLAGDWTRTPVNAGSVEAAVQSGRTAAAALIAAAGEPMRIRTAAAASAGVPAYVEYGGLTSAPGPLLCEGTTLYGFWARCDRDRLETLCRKVFDEPSGGAVRVTPLLDHAVITFGLIERIQPQTPPFDDMGTVAERHAAIWIPVRCRGPEGTPAVGVFLPYLWLDDPISVASGREVYGYAKNWGYPRFAGDGVTPSSGSEPPRSFQLDAHAIRTYGRGEQPSRQRLFEIAPAGLVDTLLDWATPDDLGDFVGMARASLASLSLAHEELEDLGESRKALRALLSSEVPQIFLRQFRDPSTEGAASQLQIVTAPARIVPGSFSARPLGGHRLEVVPLDSHPLGAQLGLKDGPLGPSFRVRMDFVVERGQVLWSAGSP
jgi:uncharacterized protein with NAD-binding domain and iron-sulfur cluster